MSFHRAKTLLRAGSHILRRVNSCNSAVTLSGSQIMQRSLTRSMWHMSRRHEDRATLHITHATRWSRACQCCIHTEGDKKLCEFLDDEIKDEHSAETTMPSLQGFQLTKSGSSEVEFTRTQDNETMILSFNINDTVIDMGNMEEPQEQGDNVAPELLSRPPFTLDLTKGGDVLSVDFRFQDAEMEVQETDYPADGGLLIEGITLLKKGETRGDGHFTLGGESMDPRMYELLMEMLEERGITNKFAEGLVQFSTAYEHQAYVTFLEKLKGFSSKS